MTDVPSPLADHWSVDVLIDAVGDSRPNFGKQMRQTPVTYQHLKIPFKA